MSPRAPLAAVCGGPLQADLLRRLVAGTARTTCWPAGCFISLARRGLIDGRDQPTDAGRDAVAVSP